jgi:hypothetical protein
MKKVYYFFIFVILLIVLGLAFFVYAEPLFAPNNSAPLNNTACINSNCFSVEIANTEAEREQGLMFRQNLDNDKGMLFIFDKEGVYPFWMKNTLIPLDMIWIDKNYKVVFIGKNSRPCQVNGECPSIIPDAKAMYVLEINSGLSDRISIQVGDSVYIK